MHSILFTVTILTKPSWSVVTPASWIQDNLVLQTNSEYGSRSFLSGTAAPRERVSISIGGAEFPVVADADGRWESVENHASGDIVIKGEDGVEHTASNVASGDVYFCSGQSNMVFPMGLTINATAEMETLKDYPEFRFFMTAGDYAAEPQLTLKPPQSDCDNSNASLCAKECWNKGNSSMCNRWVTAEEAMADNYAYLSNFSAVCFMTVRNIAMMHTSKRPVGLVLSAWGGTRVEAWMSDAAIVDASKRVLPSSTILPTGLGTLTDQNSPSGLFNAMTAPFDKLSIRAMLWYQGEANCRPRFNVTSLPPGTDTTQLLAPYYSAYLQSMIADLRDRKGMGDFAFSAMSLPPSIPSGGASQLQTGRPEIRIATLEASPHPGGRSDITGIPVTIDLGGASAWGYDHPPNKNEMSRRMALQLLHSAFAQQSPLWTGPVVDSIKLSDDGNSIELFYKPDTANKMTLVNVKAQNINGSANDCKLCCQGEPPFEVLIGGAWQRVAYNDIHISEPYVVLSGSFVKGASSVRYAWSDYVECVIANDNGLPAAPSVFRLEKQHETISFNQRIQDQYGKDKPISAPPLGFNSWNFYHCNIDENIVREIADTFVAKNMTQVGYQYVNIDDCWQVARDPKTSRIIPDPVRFPSGMRNLTDYVHSLGVKFGLYTARGSGTCQGRPGSLNYELIDAQTYCDWRIDYIKIDACHGAKDSKTSWSRFHEGIMKCYNETGHFIVQMVESCDSPDTCGEWIGTVANAWRTGGDVQNTWSSIMHNIHSNDKMAAIARPGNFNDADMLQVGNPGLTLDEQRSHFALWAIAASPLLSGTDLVHASQDTMSILTAREIIGINQDFGLDGKIQGRLVRENLVSVSPATAIVDKCDSSAEQEWEVIKEGEAVKLRNVASGGFLTVPGCERAPLPRGIGPTVLIDNSTISPCGGSNQLWSLNSNQTISSLVDNSCLNVRGNGHHNIVQTFSCEAAKGEFNSVFEFSEGKIKAETDRCVEPGSSGPTPRPYSSNSELWVKPLSDGKSVALVLVNLNDDNATDLTVSWTQLNMSGSLNVRDLWAEKDIGIFKDSYTAEKVPPHGNVALKISSDK